MLGLGATFQKSLQILDLGPARFQESMTTVFKLYFRHNETSNSRFKTHQLNKMDCAKSLLLHPYRMSMAKVNLLVLVWRFDDKDVNTKLLF